MTAEPITHDALDISHAAGAECEICHADPALFYEPTQRRESHPDEIQRLTSDRGEPRNPDIARSLKTDTLRLAFAIGWLRSRAETDPNIAELLAYIDRPEEVAP